MTDNISELDITSSDDEVVQRRRKHRRLRLRKPTGTHGMTFSGKEGNLSEKSSTPQLQRLLRLPGSIERIEQLVGKRVRVEWSQTEAYSGTCTDIRLECPLDDVTRAFVVYDDGEEIWESTGMVGQQEQIDPPVIQSLVVSCPAYPFLQATSFLYRTERNQQMSDLMRNRILRDSRSLQVWFSLSQMTLLAEGGAEEELESSDGESNFSDDDLSANHEEEVNIDRLPGPQ